MPGFFLPVFRTKARNPFVPPTALHEELPTSRRRCRRRCTPALFHLHCAGPRAHREKCMLRRLPGLLGFGMLCLGLLLATPSLAQDVPTPLRDWQSWVLHDAPRHGCPFIA